MDSPKNARPSLTGEERAFFAVERYLLVFWMYSRGEMPVSFLNTRLK